VIKKYDEERSLLIPSINNHYVSLTVRWSKKTPIRSNYSRWVEYQHLRTNANVPVRSMRRIYMRGSVRETASRVMINV